MVKRICIVVLFVLFVSTTSFAADKLDGFKLGSNSHVTTWCLNGYKIIVIEVVNGITYQTARVIQVMDGDKAVQCTKKVSDDN